MARETDKERDRHIQKGMLANTYTAGEQMVSWCCHLEREMTFPFQVRCIEERTILSLCEGEGVPVIGMTNEAVSSCEVFVLMGWKDRELGALLSRPEVLDVDQDTREAVGD